MQTSAVPDLAHTQTRPVHWLATAAAMAAVVAVAGLLQPEDATASQSPSDRAPEPGRTAAAAPAPDPAEVELPLECGGAPGRVTRKATGDLDGDGGPETVVVARCDAGSGTPPSGIYVLAGSRDAGPRVVATLLAPADKASVGDLALSDGVITATLLGYSSPNVPSCCPDRQERVKWQWRGGKFVRTSEGAGSQALGV
ncbi:hypothetical protein ACFYT4_19650 [Streptomyces sp. NPDC004609]|uniref:hypothetical protein n=1 Tax=Streptomyces sp. NPDC004609 TaxID=3364704 RepID=UPI003685D274